MRKSTVYDYSFEANYSSTICSRLASSAMSLFFIPSSSDDLFSAMAARTFGTAKLRKKEFEKPFSILRKNKVEPNLKSVAFDKRQYTELGKRSEASTEFEKRPMFEHEPYCPLFEVKPNSTIDDRRADREKKFLNFHTNQNKSNFQKSLRIGGSLNAKDLVDKYFDG